MLKLFSASRYIIFNVIFASQKAEIKAEAKLAPLPQFNSLCGMHHLSI